MSINSQGDLVIVDSAGKSTVIKSITLQKDVVIDGVAYKISYGPGATSGDLVAIFQPASAVKLTVKDSDFPSSTLGISSQALAIVTFNPTNKTMVVESGTLGTVTVNNVALRQGERVAVNANGTLVRNLGSGPAPSPTAAVVQNDSQQSGGTPDQPVPEVTDFDSGPGMGNGLLATFSINLNPEAATPVLSGQ